VHTNAHIEQKERAHNSALVLLILIVLLILFTINNKKSIAFYVANSGMYGFTGM
jgi:uncharacterized integral membrane protein